jgi:hypothetical protein
VLADKEPRPGTHEEFVKPLWKQGIGSTIHCVAGDATGIIIAAAITAMLGLPMWLDIIIEYIAGFALGLFIFQALFMKNMMGGTYWENVRNSFMPEFISMNAMMAGMAPVMAILMMGRDMRAMWPGELLFWGVMALRYRGRVPDGLSVQCVASCQGPEARPYDGTWGAAGTRKGGAWRACRTWRHGTRASAFRFSRCSRNSGRRVSRQA